MNAGIVKIAPATSASPTDAAVRTMFCSSSVPRNHGNRNSAMAMTAAGIVAATVCPARIPRYAFADPNTSERKRPSRTALMVISAGDFWPFDINRDGSKARDNRGMRVLLSALIIAVVAFAQTDDNLPFPPHKIVGNV